MRGGCYIEINEFFFYERTSSLLSCCVCVNFFAYYKCITIQEKRRVENKLLNKKKGSLLPSNTRYNFLLFRTPRKKVLLWGEIVGDGDSKCLDFLIRS